MDQQTLAAELVTNMRVEWVIRQRVSTAKQSWLVDVEANTSERVARIAYDRFVKDNPSGYFELIAVVHAEFCRDFTAHR